MGPTNYMDVYFINSMSSSSHYYYRDRLYYDRSITSGKCLHLQFCYTWRSLYIVCVYHDQCEIFVFLYIIEVRMFTWSIFERVIYLTLLKQMEKWELFYVPCEWVKDVLQIVLLCDCRIQRFVHFCCLVVKDITDIYITWGIMYKNVLRHHWLTCATVLTYTTHTNFYRWVILLYHDKRTQLT